MSYRCICGFKTLTETDMKAHMKHCSSHRGKTYRDDSGGTTTVASILSVGSYFDLGTASSDSSSSSDSYSGGGGSFDGGGSSGDW